MVRQGVRLAAQPCRDAPAAEFLAQLLNEDALAEDSVRGEPPVLPFRSPSPELGEPVVIAERLIGIDPIEASEYTGLT